LAAGVTHVAIKQASRKAGKVSDVKTFSAFENCTLYFFTLDVIYTQNGCDAQNTAHASMPFLFFNHKQLA
jgi:hypothetical protein